MLTVIYRARAGADLEGVLAVLNGGGLRPVVLDDASPDGAMVYASADTVRIRVAVPRSEAMQAAELLRDNAHVSSESTRMLARRVETGALLLGLGAVALIGIVLLGRELAPGIAWATIAWIVGGLGIVLLLILGQRSSSRREE